MITEQNIMIDNPGSLSSSPWHCQWQVQALKLLIVPARVFRAGILSHGAGRPGRGAWRPSDSDSRVLPATDSLALARADPEASESLSRGGSGGATVTVHNAAAATVPVP